MFKFRNKSKKVPLKRNENNYFNNDGVLDARKKAKGKVFQAFPNVEKVTVSDRAADDFVRHFSDKWRYSIPRWFQDKKIEIKFGLQRAVRGFDDRMVWGHNTAMAELFVKIFKKFKENNMGWPASLNSDEEWHEILDKVIRGFEAYLEYDECFIEDENGNYDAEATQEKSLQLWAEYREGVKLYFEYFPDFWN